MNKSIELNPHLNLRIIDPEDVIETLERPINYGNFTEEVSKQDIEHLVDVFCTSTDSFVGEQTMEECKEGMYGNYQYGAEHIKNVAMREATYDKARLLPSAVGGCPNVGAFLAGRPDSMWNRKKVSVPSRVMSIVLLADWHYKDSGEKIMKAAERVAPFITGLEISGIQCEFYVVEPIFYSKNVNYDATLFAFRVKAFGSRMNPGRTAFMCGSLGFKRRVWCNYLMRGDIDGKLDENLGGVPSNEYTRQKIGRACDEGKLPMFANVHFINLREVASRNESEYKDYIKSCLA